MRQNRDLSIYETARRRALDREGELRDQMAVCTDADRAEFIEVYIAAYVSGFKQGVEEVRQQVTRNLIAMNLLTDEQIATATGLTEADVKALRST